MVVISFFISILLPFFFFSFTFYLLVYFCFWRLCICLRWKIFVLNVERTLSSCENKDVACKNPTCFRLQTNMVIIYNHFRTKTAQKPHALGRHIPI